MYHHRLLRAAVNKAASVHLHSTRRRPTILGTIHVQGIPSSRLASIRSRIFSTITGDPATAIPSQEQRRSKSTVATFTQSDHLGEQEPEAAGTCRVPATALHRLERIRNVGILAHVDAGKTTVTERMLALAGVVRQVGRVDLGNTVTDYLPQERERGITIQSAAIQFDWGWHHAHYHASSAVDLSVDTNDRVHIHLIDTPGHIDFSVEVHRSVAVLDGAVLVVDAVAGVQAQTETVWRTMQDTGGLPALITINKMDKEGCHFAHAIQTIRDNLPNANPLPIQLPLFRLERRSPQDNHNCLQLPNIVALPNSLESCTGRELTEPGEFVGVLDLIHLRAIVYPETTANSTKSVDDCIPDVYPLVLGGGASTLSGDIQDALIDPDCALTQAAVAARQALVEQLAGDCGDALMEEYYLRDAMPSPRDLQQAIRTATCNQTALPVVAAAALRGKGIEPLLDAIADLLPSPLDRPAPVLLPDKETCHLPSSQNRRVTLGHPLHQDLLAFAFKVCHLTGGRGGSGDGRVVFCRVYSGTLSERDVLQVVSPPEKGVETIEEARKERVGGLLELKGGLFTNKENGVCHAGDVCALVGLKTVVTGDTLLLAKKRVSKKEQRKGSSGDTNGRMVCLAGVSSPKPVLQVRLEAETQSDQNRLSECLQILAVEDPSLCIEESEAGTLLSGLGELHIEITLDRLSREFGLTVHQGTPLVAFRETLVQPVETKGLLHFDRTVGDTRLQGAVHLKLEPDVMLEGDEDIRSPMDPTISVGPQVLDFLQLKSDWTKEQCMAKCRVYKALVQGCLGALKRGSIGSYAMANIHCHVHAIDADEGLSGLQALPGAIRAAAMNAVATTMSGNVQHGRLLEPSMSVEINVPNDVVGSVLSDLSNRRGTVGDVVTGNQGGTVLHQKTLIRGQVPLVEILGYANALRSLTAGEGIFTAEYKGHGLCNKPFSGGQ